jgi:glycosyltransferase involved in cell wall biosynthesis
MIYVIIPVFNDWKSTAKLVLEVKQFINEPAHFVLVDDCSIESYDINHFSKTKFDITIVRLNRNLGHQKAIAIGLSFVSCRNDLQFAVVMDGDGEDLPSDLPILIQASKISKGIVFAQRAKRSESFQFKFFYILYRATFKALTGKSISFGNFSVIPRNFINQLVHLSELWSHYSGGIVRSGIPISSVPTARGKRYYGASKMNFQKLFLHGFSSISVYADLMALRLMILSFVTGFTSIFGFAIVLLIRFFTDFAVPGWATNSMLALLLVLLVSLFFCFTLLFNLLAIRNQRSVIPAIDFKDYIKDFQVLSS